MTPAGLHFRQSLADRYRCGSEYAVGVQSRCTSILISTCSIVYSSTSCTRLHTITVSTIFPCVGYRTDAILTTTLLT